MKHVLTVIGARPQFIKLAPVAAALRAAKINTTIVHTGQHSDYAMSEVFFRELGIPKPKHNLGVSGGTHGVQTANMLPKLEAVMQKAKPDLVLVFGDTNSTLAGALAAAKLHIPIGHVEAGMRSFNMLMPEEVNRIVTDHIATLHFCATPTAVSNLKNEGVTSHVYHTGDVMADLLKQQAKVAKPTAAVSALRLEPKKYILMTVHRASNTDTRDHIFNLARILSSMKEPVVFPLHPRTQKTFVRYKLMTSLRKLPNLHIIDPVSYREMIWLQQHAKTIMTDSGGVQKEAYMLGVPCITLREETEWVETVKSGWNTLTGMDVTKVMRALEKARPRGAPAPVYGTGNASAKIARIISNYIGQ